MVFIRNRQATIIEDYLDGFCRTNPKVKKVKGLPIVLQKVQDDHLVPIISGGGSGHEPAHIGFVGKGMLTAAVYGEIFTPPTAEEVFAAIRAVDKGKGVFLIVKTLRQTLSLLEKPSNWLGRRELQSSTLYPMMIFRSILRIISVCGIGACRDHSTS